ncbi:MAG: hypothetical protein NT133_24510, partial [Alphaproteobacteria bacterium]|nr:hypothetical protein [Alphaproteobacteria bacterium]
FPACAYSQRKRRLQRAPGGEAMTMSGRFACLWLGLFALAGCAGSEGPGMGDLAAVPNELRALAPRPDLQAAAERSCTTEPRYDPRLHVLTIDDRGGYRPIAVTCRNQSVLRQIHAGALGDGVPPQGQMAASFDCVTRITERSAGDEKTLNEYNAVLCQIERILDALARPPDGVEPRRPGPRHLMVFIHGGLTSQRRGLERALENIPLIADNGDIFKQIGGTELLAGSEAFPLFLNWPSSFIDTYADSVTHYAQGEYGGPLRSAEAPLYLLNDIAEAVIKMPLDMLKAGHRHLAPSFDLAGGRGGCDFGANFGCNTFGHTWERPLQTTAIYTATLPTRLITVPALDIGTRAWKNMVARTRFGVERYVTAEQQAAVLSTALRPLDAKTKDKQRILTTGVFRLFFERYAARFASAATATGGMAACDPRAPRITLIGHSMGAMVANELLREFPRLGYQNIVFMAGAGSIRDFRVTTEVVLRNPRCPADLRFYNLTLHEDWDRKSIELGGAAPMGSLLEWIDDIFEYPVTPADRTIGKWRNIVYAQDQFHPDAIGRMFFHRFGLEAPDPVAHGGFAQWPPSPAEKAAMASDLCPPLAFWDPRFWAVVRESGKCDGTPLVTIRTPQPG